MHRVSPFLYFVPYACILNTSPIITQQAAKGLNYLGVDAIATTIFGFFMFIWT